MKCTSPFKKEIDGVVYTLPCGQCMSCRLNHARMWSIRISHEASTHLHNVFLTLTYDDEHLPVDNSVHKRDLQLFFKRLRKSLGTKIRYFACGEYGDKFGRPHYHAIVFGLSADCAVFRNKKFDRKTQGYYCDMPCWDKGFVHIGSVTVDSANYVAGYVTKKLKGKNAKDYYLQKGIEPEFVLMSRRPGIGSDFFMNTSNSSKTTDLFGVKIKSIICPDIIKNVLTPMFCMIGKLTEKCCLTPMVMTKPKHKDFLIVNMLPNVANSWMQILEHIKELEEVENEK